MKNPFYSLLVLVLLLGACQGGKKISAQAMKKSLNEAIYNFNKDLNSRRVEDARSFVGERGEKAFEKLVAGLEEPRFNFFLADGPPRIDYLKGTAVVSINAFLGEKIDPEATTTGNANMKLVEKKDYRWEYVNGGWQWLGPAN